MKLQLYIGNKCTLCEDAKIQLEILRDTIEQDLHIEVINIESNDALLKKYMLSVPVVVYKDEVLQEGRVDFITLYDKLNKKH